MKEIKNYSNKGVNAVEGKRAGCQEGKLFNVITSGCKCLVGFTLAEVLITLAIIGVVAAMTIPSLLTKLDKVVKSNQMKVFEKKLEQGMDAMNLAGEIGPYYNTTEDFVKKLSEHMKIVTICSKTELQNCFPYDEIKIKDDNNILISELIPSKLGIYNGAFRDLAGMVLADGTPMIVTWNTNCDVSDPDSSSRKGSITGEETPFVASACLKGIYDLNGTKGPNLFTKDIVAYGGALPSSKGYVEVAGLKIKRVLPAGTFQPMLYSEICTGNTTGNVTYIRKGTEKTVKNITKADTTEAMALGIKSCYYDNDYWAGAVRECGGINKVPTMADLAALANALYAINGEYNANVTPYANDSAASGQGYSYQSTSEAGQFLSAAGLNANSAQFHLWSSEEESNEAIYKRNFYTDYTSYSRALRDRSNHSVICLEE